MSHLIKNIREIEFWWNSLSSEWKHFFCVNYLYNQDPVEFKELVKSVLTGNYMEDWLVPFYIPSICHYTLKARTILNFHTRFLNHDETAVFSFDIENLEPLSNLVNIERVQFPRTLKNIDCSFLHYTREAREIAIMSDHIDLIPSILSIQLPRLKKVEIYISEIEPINQERELTNLCLKNGVELAFYSDENDPRILVDIFD